MWPRAKDAGRSTSRSQRLAVVEARALVALLLQLSELRLQVVVVADPSVEEPLMVAHPPPLAAAAPAQAEALALRALSRNDTKLVPTCWRSPEHTHTISYLLLLHLLVHFVVLSNSHLVTAKD